MSEEQSGSIKKDKKKRNEENELDKEATLTSQANGEEKKAKKPKKGQTASTSDEISVDRDSDVQVSGEETKKKKKKSKQTLEVDGNDHKNETNTNTGGSEPERVGPKHDRDVAGVVASFQSAIIPAREGNDHGLEEDINITRFIRAFKDLLPILRLLGTAFYFVEQDIVQKLNAIEANREPVKDDPHAQNIVDFIAWEKETKPKFLTDKHSTARHTLRLMRALHFINLFLDRLNTPGMEPKPAAKEAYGVSLSQYHPWSVRTAVGVAFYTLPYRKNFMKHLDLDYEAPDVFADFVRVTGHIRTILNLYYDANDLQNLP